MKCPRTTAHRLRFTFAPTEAIPKVLRNKWRAPRALKVLEPVIEAWRQDEARDAERESEAA